MSWRSSSPLAGPTPTTDLCTMDELWWLRDETRKQFQARERRSQTHVVVTPVTFVVISIGGARRRRNKDLKLVRNCFDIKPYSTKPTAALINASKSISSPKRE